MRKLRDNDSAAGVAVRHLEDLHEEANHGSSSRLSALVLASFGGATIVFCALALMRGSDEAVPKAEDPLGALVQKSAGQPVASAKQQRLAPKDVTFPSVLSDEESTTTAMELVRGDKGKLSLPQPDADGADLVLPSPYDTPPVAGDRLLVVPLPASEMVPHVRSSLAPGDTLRSVARRASREDANGEMAEAGKSGGYQLQVASFKKPEDADTCAGALRRRGQRAHVEQAQVRGRGLWHRVRIGPFRYKRSAAIYRQDFEAKERMVTFVVNPPKTRIRISMSDNDSAE